MLELEADIPRDVVEGLQRRGHKTKPRDPATSALSTCIVRTAAGLRGRRRVPQRRRTRRILSDARHARTNPSARS